MPVLRNGDDSPWIGEAQKRLKHYGAYTKRIDNDFGDGTANAVRAFQLSRHLAVTGEVDADTARALDLTHLVGPAKRPVPEAAALLFPGARFANVAAHLPYVVRGLVAHALTDKPMLLMALATIRAETSGFLPISEGRSKYNTTPSGHPFNRYDNRKKSLGNLGRPDGERFKGRGFVQLTGRANYTNISRRLGLGARLVDEPELANDPEIAGRILAAFLKREERRVRAALKKKDLAAARKVVNGGVHGQNPFRIAFLRGEEVFAGGLTLTRS
ncbi:MAG: peptidoglycan-binding protein [Acidobacteria bacterium]|nr:peptidoglycan-binding protein [Acidobacteriota bacterium]